MVSQRAPNLFLVGVARSGTTTVAEWLNSHSDISYGKIKEPKYHTGETLLRKFDGPGDKFVKSEIKVTHSDYLDNYRGCHGNRYLMDASSNYFYFHETVIPSILSTAGDVPIIICLRKNVDRAISAYMNLVRDGRETLSFMEAMIESYEGTRHSYDWMWDIFFGSQYVEGLKAFFSNFSRVKVLWYEEIFLEPQSTINDLTVLHLERHSAFDPYLRLSVSGIPVNSIAKLLLSRDDGLAIE